MPALRPALAAAPRSRTVPAGYIAAGHSPVSGHATRRVGVQPSSSTLYSFNRPPSPSQRPLSPAQHRVPCVQPYTLRASHRRVRVPVCQECLSVPHETTLLSPMTRGTSIDRPPLDGGDTPSRTCRKPPEPDTLQPSPHPLRTSTRWPARTSTRPLHAHKWPPGAATELSPAHSP